MWNKGIVGLARVGLLPHENKELGGGKGTRSNYNAEFFHLSLLCNQPPQNTAA